MSNLHALFIEDNENDFLLVKDYLEINGLSVIGERVDTEESLRKALTKPWDIVFSDFSMPKLNGLRALKIVRDIDRDVPFIYVSGTIGENAAVNAIKSGAQDYVMKSDLARLIPTIERELEETKKKQARLESEDLLRKMSSAIGQTADGVIITDKQGKIEYVNPAFEKLSGYSLKEVRGHSPAFLNSGHHDSEFFSNLWATVLNGENFTGIVVNKKKDGTIFYEDKVISPLTNSEGEITHFVATGRDITARIDAQRETERLKSVLKYTPDFVVITDENGAILYLNDFGRDWVCDVNNAEIDQGQKTLWTLLSDASTQSIQSKIYAVVREKGRWSGEILLERYDKSTAFPASVEAAWHEDKVYPMPYISLIARDITERKKFESELQYQATHDSLTGLPNRFLFVKKLEEALCQSSRNGRYFAVLFLDIDDFKRVNDSLGHSAGDHLLRQFSNRLKECVRPTDTLARLGGDEFTLLLSEIEGSREAVFILNRIFKAFEHSLILEKQELFVSLSVGVAIYPEDGDNELDLLRHADLAMYQAKERGSNQYQFYSREMDEYGHQLIQMDTDLRYAIANDELCLHYQPQMNISSNKIIGVEALLRWQHPEKGMILPGAFIPLLETSGLIVGVGEWIIRQACEQYLKFCEIGRAEIGISVNVSALQIFDRFFQQKVETIIKCYNIPAGILELEITENVVMRDPVKAAAIMVALKRLGVRIAIDDFGTGYSSLAYLKRFPVSTLKIDQSFIRDVLESSSDAAIVQASIMLAHNLGIEVIAEGVEQHEQWDLLAQYHCDNAQGYLISKPLSSVDVMALLIDHEPRR